MMSLAQVSASEKDLDKALDYLQKIRQIRGFPLHLVYANIGLIQGELGQLQAAEQNLQKAIELSPNNAKAYSVMGTLKIGQEDYVNAEKYFLKVAELNPFLLHNILNLADLYIMTKRYSAALPWLEKAIEIKPAFNEKNSVLIKIAVGYAKLKEIDKMHQYIDLVFKNEHSADNYLRLSYELLNNGAHKIAITVLKNGLQFFPNDKEILLFYGTLLGNEGRLQEAVHWWQKGESLYQDDPRFADNITSANSLLEEKSLNGN